MKPQHFGVVGVFLVAFCQFSFLCEHFIQYFHLLIIWYIPIENACVCFYSQKSEEYKKSLAIDAMARVVCSRQYYTTSILAQMCVISSEFPLRSLYFNNI